MKRFVFTPALLLLMTTSLYAQFVSDKRTAALDSLQKLKPLFKAAKDDSVFVSKYSERHYSILIFERGDQAEDIEDQIYKTPVGGVAGPFKGGGDLNYIFKIKGIEKYVVRSRANQIFVKWTDMSRQDTAKLRRLAEKYAEAIARGKDAEPMAEKDNVRLVVRDLKWYYPKDTLKPYFNIIFHGAKNRTEVVPTEHGPAIIHVTHEHEKAAYRVKLVPVVRKGGDDQD